MIERLAAILLLCGLIGVAGCVVVKIAQCKCWQFVNRNVLLRRCIEQYKAIGP